MSGLIALDWGTSQLRAYRLDNAGLIHDARTRPWGVRHLPDGGFDAALADITTGWPALPRLACGMVGSRQGWLEVPYVDLPADLDRLGAGMRQLRAADGLDVHIVPGLRNPHGPDVMRGEETQIIGAMALQPSLAAASNWILPGTHSKWASVRNGAVTDFCTLMTGELFSLLWNHSILGTGQRDALATPDAFERGILAARDSDAEGALSRLFSARSLMLEGSLAPGAVSEYLSGLLIGEEFRIALAARRFPPNEPFQLIGDAALCDRYRLAASHFGVTLRAPVVDAAAHGLWHIAHHIGLVSSNGPSLPKDSKSC
ncbi:2-dehydro-3-deoxygalactonokinase [Dyella silvae]|uniref:2-dehydro-3-deoxygalactonokinase n=1 Tax=Dyella silvae TaxID=2994424 RepID=UPI002264F2A1|nr:2-dehydro-3-deoxygalactonokinase [Dyella silvae]